MQGRPPSLKRLTNRYLVPGHREARLQQTVRLVARALGFPMGQINILDEDQQHTVADFDAGGRRTLPLDQTICRHVVSQGGTLVIEDLTADGRTKHLAEVRDGLVRSYLGTCITGRERQPIGTVCLFDREPRTVDARMVEQLREFAAIVEDQLELVRQDAEDGAGQQYTTREMLRALERGDIVPWYQPAFDLRTGRRIGWECLARWRRPDGQVEAPDRFLPKAEGSDVVLDLDLAVMRAAAQDKARWAAVDPALRLAVNLSTRHLETDDGAARLHAVISAAGVDPASITLEITESRAIIDPERARETILELREHGYKVVLDDFGNGWSSLAWMLELRIDGIKLDRSVAQKLGTPWGNAIARAVTGLVGELGMTATIEGLTTPEQIRLATELGFTYGQGYYWSPAVPADVVDAELA